MPTQTKQPGMTYERDPQNPNQQKLKINECVNGVLFKAPTGGWYLTLNISDPTQPFPYYTDFKNTWAGVRHDCRFIQQMLTPTVYHGIQGMITQYNQTAEAHQFGTLCLSAWATSTGQIVPVLFRVKDANAWWLTTDDPQTELLAIQPWWPQLAEVIEQADQLIVNE